MKHSLKTGIACVALLLLLAASALAETYTYGGSGNDSLYDIAVAEDGRMLMTGYTTSTDRTLASRTKSGHSGWALCVDARGEVLWSFCSRNASGDSMHAPVFHDDGTATVLLCSSGSERQMVEMIRLDAASGDVIGRTTLMEIPGDRKETLFAGEQPRAFAGGYALLGVNAEEGYVFVRRYFDWNGRLLGQRTEDRASIVSMAHAIEMHDGAYWLCALAEDGTDTPLAKTTGRNRVLLSLPDGGAAACSREESDGKETGKITRWDAQGNVLWEASMGGGEPCQLLKTPTGFVATIKRSLPGNMALLYLDEMGRTVESVEDFEGGWRETMCMAVLPDGRVASLCDVETGMVDNRVCYDAVLRILPD